MYARLYIFVHNIYILCFDLLQAEMVFQPSFHLFEWFYAICFGYLITYMPWLEYYTPMLSIEQQRLLNVVILL